MEACLQYLEHMVLDIRGEVLDLRCQQDIQNHRQTIFFDWLMSNEIIKEQLAPHIAPSTTSDIPIILPIKTKDEGGQRTQIHNQETSTINDEFRAPRWKIGTSAILIPKDKEQSQFSSQDDDYYGPFPIQEEPEPFGHTFLPNASSLGNVQIFCLLTLG